MPMTDTRSGSETGLRDLQWGETLDRLRRFIGARVGDPELAADITQDILVRSIATGALDRADNITAWLYTAARNAVIDHYRTRRRHVGGVDLDHWPEPDTSGNLPNDATRELARCLQPMLGQLHPIARDALTRVDLEGQTHKEAAAQLGISVSGMKSRVQRARRELKAQLTSCCRVRTDSSGAVSDYSPNRDACGCPGDDAGRAVSGGRSPDLARGRLLSSRLHGDG
jgi:RNA polymerase sigma-70 factor (ECF subfamily)